MAKELTVEDVEVLLGRLRGLVEKQECWSCDCLQGLITQLELDVAGDVSHVTASFKVPREKLHSCLGCDPCPPAALFAQYIRSRMEP
jgi:hypothetical protein